MPKLPLILATLAFTLPAFAAEPHRFFANAGVQAQAPAAFALQPEALPALTAIEEAAPQDTTAFLVAIEAQPELKAAVRNFPSLAAAEREAALRQLFALEVSVLGIEAPELVIMEGATPGPAYFDFDLAKPGPGKVILNPAELAKLDPYASVSLLLHETRHSAQFQLAQKESTPRARGYLAAFKAQKELSIRSFCDYLTLLNEYEAFRYGNYLLGALIGFENRLKDMGTWASQFAPDSRPLIDLPALHRSGGSVLEKFNELEKAQLIELGGKL